MNDVTNSQENNIDFDDISNKVLLVDDNDNLLASIKRQFRKQIKLETANSGALGLERIKNEGPYAVVISDMQMPEMDGITFLSKVRELSNQTIRIMLTGNANLDVATDGINKGSLFRFLTKPVAKELLLSTIMDGIEQYKLVAEHEQLFSIINKQNTQLKDLNQNLEEKVNLRTADLNKANETLKKQNIEVIMTFSKIIELRPGIAKEHAVYGVINMLKRLKNDYPVNQVAIIFDAKGKTFRDEMFPDYKANRPSMPDDLRGQIAPLHELIKALGFPLIAIPGVEADDVIGTFAKQAEIMGMDVVISTGDKDLAQLVTKHISLIDTMKNQALDIAAVEEKFGVLPEQIIDYLALVGDTSDNVPGVPKVGPKTAVKWLKQHQNIANIIEKADEFTGKVGENLRSSIEQLRLSYQLVTIKCDVLIDKHKQLSESIEQLQLKAPDIDKIKQLYSQLEFKNWLAKLLEDEKIISILTIYLIKYY